MDAEANNWYLDVWCHQADDLRTFAVERMMDNKLLDVEVIKPSELRRQLAQKLQAAARQYFD